MPHKYASRIRDISSRYGLILLYHSVSESVPEALQGRLHNISPEILQRHLEDLSTWFRFVSLDEFASEKNKCGLAAVTFDDGYANVLDNAVDMLTALDCPATLFVNPLTFSGHWNWRDKVRYVIHHGLEQDFHRHRKLKNRSGRFYRYTKHPDNNSQVVDEALDEFLDGWDIDLYCGYPYLGSAELAGGHSLLSFGNHSQNHYVLSSLTASQQHREIETAHRLLHEIREIPLSRCFSAPFGGSADILPETTKIAASLGYHSILMSRQRLQPGRPDTVKIQLLERIMPKTADIIGEIVETKL